MGDPPSPHVPMPPPPSSSSRSNLPMFYYGLVVIGTATIILALYNLIIIRWCADVTDQRTHHRAGRAPPGGPSFGRSLQTFSTSFVRTYKYKKDGVEREGGSGYECAVCLSVFEEGEELRQLPKCKHSFHASCIDMWLYSHMDCPLCRSPVEPPGMEGRCEVAEQAEHSREGLLGHGLV